MWLRSHHIRKGCVNIWLRQAGTSPGLNFNLVNSLRAFLCHPLNGVFLHHLFISFSLDNTPSHPLRHEANTYEIIFLKKAEM